jgi:hypothetical protein
MTKVRVLTRDELETQMGQWVREAWPELGLPAAPLIKARRGERVMIDADMLAEVKASFWETVRPRLRAWLREQFIVYPEVSPALTEVAIEGWIAGIEAAGAYGWQATTPWMTRH